MKLDLGLFQKVRGLAAIASIKSLTSADKLLVHPMVPKEPQAMSLFDRVSRLLRANLNDLISKAEDPTKILEQAVIDMQEDLGKLKGAVAQAIATQNRTQQQCDKNRAEMETWQNRAQLALQKGDEALAREALTRKQSYAETTDMLQKQLTVQSQQTATLKRSLMALESKITEAKTKKNMLQARHDAAIAQQRIGATVNGMAIGGAMEAYERMEDKVLQLEARTQASFELAGAGLEQQYAQLEANSAVEDELAAMKAQLLGTTATSVAELPPGEAIADLPPANTVEPVDAQLQSAPTTTPEELAAMADELDELAKILGNPA